MSSPLGYTYMMEGPGEEDRLCFKDNSQATLSQLLNTGISHLRHKPTLVDAGAGVGVVAKLMCQLLQDVYQGGKITLLDGSSERLNVASQELRSFSGIDKSFVDCNLEQIPLEDNTADYVFCRFVFEYLEDKEAVFRELSRIVKPGGKLVVGDLDMNCLNHYPISEDMQAKLDELAKAVEKSKMLDLNAGRKLYHLFYKSSYKKIRVHVEPHHLFYGDLKASDYENWRIKLARLSSLQESSRLNLSFNLREFSDDFLAFLRSPERFSYTPLIMVEGSKP